MRVMERSHFILGPEVAAFEEEFAAYCGAKYCVGCSNGLDALQLILRAAGIGPGDEVIVPAHTFVATWMAVSAVGATPIGADCEIDTCNISPKAVESAITPRTRAIIAVHLYGRPADMRALRRIADQNHLLLIEDAAQAHGAHIDGKLTGTLGDAAAFSFYPTKNLGALGDGGAVVTNNEEIAAKVRRIGNYGSSIKYLHDSHGMNARLDEMQAAILRVKLPHLNRWNEERRAIAQQYSLILPKNGELRLPQPDEAAGPVSAWHLFVIRTSARDALQETLSKEGIQTLIHYPTPPHLQPVYAGTTRGAFPVAESICRHALSLPLYPGLSPVAIAAIVDAIVSATASSARPLAG